MLAAPRVSVPAPTLIKVPAPAQPVAPWVNVRESVTSMRLAPVVRKLTARFNVKLLSQTLRTPVLMLSVEPEGI